MRRRRKRSRGCGCLFGPLILLTGFIILYYTPIPARLFARAITNADSTIVLNGIEGSAARGFKVHELSFTEEGQTIPSISMTDFELRYSDAILAFVNQRFVVKTLAVERTEFLLTPSTEAPVRSQGKSSEDDFDGTLELQNLDFKNVRLFTANGSGDIRIRSIQAQDLRLDSETLANSFSPTVDIERVDFQDFKMLRQFMTEEALIVPERITLTLLSSDAEKGHLVTTGGSFDLGLTRFQIPQQTIPSALHFAGLTGKAKLPNGDEIGATLVRSPNSPYDSQIMLRSSLGSAPSEMCAQIYFQKPYAELSAEAQEQVDRYAGSLPSDILPN